MREGTAPTVVHRLDYAPPPYWIRTVDLTLDLDPQRTLVASRLQVERRDGVAAGTALRLHGQDLTLLRVMADGQSLTFRHEDGELVIDAPPDTPSFTLEIRNTCCPEKNTELMGLYTSGGGLFTQCEAEGFRRITYFLDRPDVMAVYTVTMRGYAKRYPVMLANGNLVETTTLPDGRTQVRWHDPHPKPSYLFALVAADLVAREQRIVSRSGKEHLLQVYVRAGDLDKTEHAMRSLVASVVWDEARFGLPLDLDRFMVVAVEDFNAGAMENKGLNLFNTKYVLASPATATDWDYAAVEAVIGHEYFHNWTGNRITCRDWFQLSLKEGLTVYRDQEFSADMGGSASARAASRVDEVQNLRDVQFPEDAGPMAHPIRPDAYAAIQNFYTSTVYEKGAEVVRMMATLVGREGFRRGMDLYFQRHDGQAVTCDDFSQAIADANPASPLATGLETFRRWYSQSGTPRVTVTAQHDAAARTYTLTLAQRNDPTAAQPAKEAQVIPVRMGLVGRDGRAVPLVLLDSAGVHDERADGSALERVLVLDAPSRTWVFEDVDAEPVPSLLRGFSAPVIVEDGLGEAELALLLRHDGDAFNRWESGQRLMLGRVLAAIREDQPIRLDDGLLDALRAVLREPGLDPAMKDLILTPPEPSYLVEQFDVVDPRIVHRVHQEWTQQMARALHDDWAAAWDAMQTTAAFEPTHEQAGPRALAGLALRMLVLDATLRGDTVWPGRAYQRVKDARNMTDRLAALTALVDAGAELAAPALERFHAQFRHEALVIDKWFAAQAGAPEPLGSTAGRTFERVRALLEHPDFNARNPNRARSLVFAFTDNLGAFHRADGAGYRLWADQVLAFDAFNAHTAARLARRMERWRQLAEPLRAMALAQLQRVAAAPTLSDDTREIIGKALSDDPLADGGDDGDED